MNIALVIFKYFPFGGIQRDLLKVARECQARGHKVCIYTLRWEAPVSTEFEVVTLPITGFHRHAQYDNFAAEVNNIVRRKQYDVILGFNKIPGLDVYYAGDTCFLEKALTQRDAWYRLLPRFKSFHHAEQAVFSEHSRTEILTISDVEIPRYRHYYRTPPERFNGLPPGIEADRVAPANKDDIGADLRAELNISADTNMLLFVGSGFKKKGLDRALHAVAALTESLRANTRFYVVGRDKAERFERLAMRLGIAELCVFFDQGRDDIPRFLFAADALIHPAYDETAGMVIVEAMLAGLPVLVTKNCGYAKFIAEHEAGIVLAEPFSQEALNTSLSTLLTSDQRKTWADNGRVAPEKAEFFKLVPEIVDYLERFVAERRPLLVFTLFRYFPYGGLQRDFLRIALACQAEGYDIYVFCLDWQGDIPEGFHVRIVDVQAVANHARYRQFADIVVAEVPWLRPMATIGFNKMPGLDFYYAADPCFEMKAQEKRTGLYRRTGRYELMTQHERAVFEVDSETRVMVITPEQQRQYQKYYNTQAERFFLLPPGVSRDRMRQADWMVQRQRIREEFNVADDTLLLLLIGSGFVTKGLDRAIAAMASLPSPLRENVHMLVVGQDNPQAFLREARRLSVDSKLTICRGRDDVPALLQGADLMVHPAVMESGGLVLIEAIIAGLPVVATQACGFAHYIEEADAGVVLAEPFSQELLVKNLTNMLMDAEQRARWSKNGVQYGQSHEDLYEMSAHAVRYLTAHLQTAAG